LRYFVRHIAHDAPPPVASIDELDVGVDIRSTATASSNNAISNDRDSFLRRNNVSSDVIKDLIKEVLRRLPGGFDEESRRVRKGAWFYEE
jgi:hypothetical protein